MGIKVLLNLAGGVALLLWGLNMVNTGIVRAFGTVLRRFLGKLLKKPFQAFLAGIGVTTILQSSTATALMLSSFTAGGLVALTPALAVMLGANVGTTLIVQLLSFDTAAFSPVLLLTGFIIFRQAKQSQLRDIGRICIGLGLMLLSLRLLVESLAPLNNSPIMQQMFQAITDEPALALLLAAIITWATHSSVATVLLTMSLAASGLISPLAAMALVLGANLGSAINPLLEGIGNDNPARKRLPLGNLLNRLLGCIIFLPILPWLAGLMVLEQSPARLTANFHFAFNLFMAAIFLVPLPLVAEFLERILPDRQADNDPAQPVYLDEKALNDPAVALSCATRETMRMGDLIEQMLHDSIVAIMQSDRKKVKQIRKMDDAVDKLHESIKFYVIKITRNNLDASQQRKAMEVVNLSINFEHIGDIIDKNLMELASKKIKYQLQFSDEGAAEIKEFHSVVMDNLKLAMTVFMTADLDAARRLLAEKNRIREMELKASESHMRRLQDGQLASLETSSLPLDILRDLKRIHSHICATAYSALESAGELRSNKLKILAGESED